MANKLGFMADEIREFKRKNNKKLEQVCIVFRNLLSSLKSPRIKIQYVPVHYDNDDEMSCFKAFLVQYQQYSI